MKIKGNNDWNLLKRDRVLFPRVTRACQGAIFTSIQLVKSLIEKTSTKTGLTVTVNLMDKVYAKGRKVVEGFKENLPIIFDQYLPKLELQSHSSKTTIRTSYLFLIPKEVQLGSKTRSRK